MTDNETIRKDYHSLVTRLEDFIADWQNNDGNTEAIHDLKEILSNRSKSDIPEGLVSTGKTGVQSLGNGRYRLSTGNRSAVTGRFHPQGKMKDIRDDT